MKLLAQKKTRADQNVIVKTGLAGEKSARLLRNRSAGNVQETFGGLRGVFEEREKG